MDSAVEEKKDFPDIQFNMDVLRENTVKQFYEVCSKAGEEAVFKCIAGSGKEIYRGMFLDVPYIIIGRCKVESAGGLICKATLVDIEVKFKYNNKKTTEQNITRFVNMLKQLRELDQYV